MSDLNFFAACAKGLEYLLRDELIALGASEVKETVAGVYFSGPLEMAYRTCLWSRLASRIVLQLQRFALENADELYDGVMAINWGEHLDPRGTLAVDAHGRHPAITHTQFAAQKVKDAIVDQCRAQLGERPSIDLDEPDLRISVVLEKHHAIIGLDLSGSPLHRRSYRIEQGEAPIKENLACAMLLRAGWPAIAAQGGSLIDPMCGSGTLLIEALWMAADVAPGKQRDYFGFLGWKQHDPKLWRALLDEAEARAAAGLKSLAIHAKGFDLDGRALQRARANAQHAGVAGFLTLEKHDVAHLEWPGERPTLGLVISNPPYGDRMGEQQALRTLYRQFGEALKAHFAGWRAAIITPDAELGFATGLKADKRYKLYNGAIECQLLVFEVHAARTDASKTAKPLDEGQQALRNRVEKNFKHLAKWREREGVECYRLYDADLPEYAAAIDVYRQDTLDWLHIQEYAAPASIPDDIAAKRMRDLTRIVSDLLAIPRERIALKERRRGKGGSKYGRMDQRGHAFEVMENGLRFEVNLFDYLDTGLFLDHRAVRTRLRDLSKGKRVLNLFCYTGTASVYAAAGGARETVSVDLSATYLEWADRNLNLNGFGGREHRLVQSDAMEFLRHERGRYDLIFVDPPTFSNSKSAEDFDVQADHVEMLQLCETRLNAGGMILFSNNNRRFKLDPTLAESFKITDTSRKYLPDDFERNPRIHQSFELSG